MNFLDELRNLDINDIGRWPLLFRAILIVIIFGVVAGGLSYYLVERPKKPVLEEAQNKETMLRETFERKQKKAANYDAYKDQLDEINRSFGAMLRQLPGETEIPSLLQDISQTGLASGLEEKLFQPLPEFAREFYAEKPIKIRLTGSYHQMGDFVSGIAALPRIVTLHDLVITPIPTNADRPQRNTDELILNVTAKTYRYMEEDTGE
ncbi:MAG: type 4a pilus biogenesis protein PilO [Gammaproteobacteria bacterium]|nr:type 4a pilus biogenesis protein PilO [Gammaproteobacteria bacterium]